MHQTQTIQFHSLSSPADPFLHHASSDHQVYVTNKNSQMTEDISTATMAQTYEDQHRPMKTNMHLHSHRKNHDKTSIIDDSLTHKVALKLKQCLATLEMKQVFVELVLVVISSGTVLKGLECLNSLEHRRHL